MAQPFASAQLIAQTFTNARRGAAKLAAYPSEPPSTLAQAYGVQDVAIDMWPQAVAGWKIAGIGDDYAAQVGAKKLVGPVFQNKIFKTAKTPTPIPIFAGGYAAIEPEIVMIVAKDAPADKTEWTLKEAQDFVGAVHIGVEIAGSPFAAINKMGPLVTISDFGNNNGLVIGSELPNYQESRLEDWTVEAIIDGESLGKKSPSGPLESFRFMLENAASRGCPLTKGMAITTGAITGVHEVRRGQSCTVLCNNAEAIHLTFVPETSG